MFCSENIEFLFEYAKNFSKNLICEDLDEKKKFIDYIIDFEYNKLGIKKPDNVIFLSTIFTVVKVLIKMNKF